MIIFKPHEALTHIKPLLPDAPIIVEAGAFAGHDSIKMATLWPKGVVHAFEPVPDIFDMLTKKTSVFKNIKRYQLALSSSTGSATFYVSEKPLKPGIPTQAGSLRKPKERLYHSSIQFPRTIEVSAITLDEWSKQNRINHVDLLWLDMQGHELSALQGAKKILQTVSVIFTEVSFIESYEGQPQYEQVKNWIEQHGFKEIGRDFENQSDWFFGNSLFVRTGA